MTAATEVSVVQASFSQPASAVVAASAAIDAPSYCLAAPTDEFPGGIEVLPPLEGPRTVEMGAHSMGIEPAYKRAPLMTRSPIVGCGVSPRGLGSHMPVVLLACILLCCGVARVAAAVHGGGGSAVAREPVVCYGQACIFSGIDSLSPVVRAQVIAAFQAAALSGGADTASGGATGGAPGGGAVIGSGTSIVG
ncbi:hypothetical protein CYMTET_20292 [Cymbomonas tetramitiformis]|uniref:Uncharacterized protein n=1 Tax=Cymbomonas tetramitiformis TaxID=36881 RepID=A0AAE0G4B9_9CHLO|nr:hypothetical protein CYMTET_20292 [Cymbomonas tetramitiformis]